MRHVITLRFSRQRGIRISGPIRGCEVPVEGDIGTAPHCCLQYGKSAIDYRELISPAK